MPIHLLPPWWRSFCSASRFFSSSISFSQPPSAWMAAFSSSLNTRSASLRSHASGIAVASGPSAVVSPLNTWPNTRSKRSRLVSSFTRQARPR